MPYTGEHPAKVGYESFKAAPWTSVRDVVLLADSRVANFPLKTVLSVC